MGSVIEVLEFLAMIKSNSYARKWLFFSPVLKWLEYPQEADMSADYDDANLSGTAREDDLGVILKAMHFSEQLWSCSSYDGKLQES